MADIRLLLDSLYGEGDSTGHLSEKWDQIGGKGYRKGLGGGNINGKL